MNFFILIYWDAPVFHDNFVLFFYCIFDQIRDWVWDFFQKEIKSLTPNFSTVEILQYSAIVLHNFNNQFPMDTTTKNSTSCCNPLSPSNNLTVKWVANAVSCLNFVCLRKCHERTAPHSWPLTSWLSCLALPSKVIIPWQSDDSWWLQWLNSQINHQRQL